MQSFAVCAHGFDGKRLNHRATVREPRAFISIGGGRENGEGACVCYEVVQYWSADIAALRVLWGFVLCVEAFFGIHTSTCVGLPAQEAVVIIAKIQPGLR